MNSVIIVGRFVDDFGYEVFPYMLESFMARYYFYTGHF